MKTLNRILVACEGWSDLDIGLEKAAYLEHYSGCEIDVLDVIWDEIEVEAVPEAVKSSLRESLIKGEQHSLEDVVKDMRSKVASLNSEVVWHKNSEQAILDHIDRRNIDLLILLASKHDFADNILTPLDWKLVRQSSCPVLICSKVKWADGSNLLAAVDTGEVDQSDLNRDIVASGFYFASLLNAQLHLVSVYPSIDSYFDHTRGAIAFDDLLADMRDVRDSGMQDLVRGEKAATTHLREGKASVEIPALANELGSVLTLIGTHGRHGLGKWILGNTSESVMSRLEGDILIVRENQAEDAH